MQRQLGRAVHAIRWNDRRFSRQARCVAHRMFDMPAPPRTIDSNEVEFVLRWAKLIRLAR